MFSLVIISVVQAENECLENSQDLDEAQNNDLQVEGQNCDLGSSTLDQSLETQKKNEDEDSDAAITISVNEDLTSSATEESEEPAEDNFEYTLETPTDPNIGTVKYSLYSNARKSTRKSADPKKLVNASLNLNSKPKNGDIKGLSFIKTDAERKSDLENYLYLDQSDRPYPCNMCPKRFKERHHLIYHIRTHSGHRPYKCPICGKAFTQSSSLNTHKRTHWKDINCQKCGKVFRKQAQFYNHLCI